VLFVDPGAGGTTTGAVASLPPRHPAAIDQSPEAKFI
jgi:hypothetical protein